MPYYLNDRDKAIIEEVVRRVRAGKVSSRPVPTRRPPRGGGGGGKAIFGIVIEDIPACSVAYSSVQSTVTAGYANNAVIPLQFNSTDLTEYLEGELNGNGDQIILPGVNPVWPTIIKAGTTTNADKPVMAIGRKKAWKQADATETAFIIENVIYPVTIVTGLTTAAVAAGADFTIDGLNVLWGRDPGVSSLSINNPVATWDANDNAYCLAMQLTDGTWQALDLDCA